MKTKAILITLLCLVSTFLSAQDKVLVFTKTNGFSHSSIDDGVALITSLGSAEGNGLWTTETTSDAADFTASNLAQYKAVIWCNTSGNNLLNASQRSAFEDFIANGGGFVGIHAATDTYRDGSWPFYNELVGGIVQSDPPEFPNHTSNNFNADMTVVNSHSTVDFLGNPGDVWNKSEEYYYWLNAGGYLYPDNINVLMVESTGSNDYDAARPISWYKEYMGGRSFYTALGHNDSDYDEEDVDNENFIRHIEEGIKYVIGNTLSVGESVAQLSFEIGPNPVNTILKFATSDVETAKDITIYNMSGQQVFTDRIPPTVTSAVFNVSHLQQGLYIGKIISGEKNDSFKFNKN
ncbi:hypothetical protein GCM10022393_22530 [Aquimarina addita]|uniref:Secreted protein (Por secretion system target) n=1 Tax=Aquimarina addita TaxID=870485 RepID=A0ABP6UJ70_9FLAO